MLNSAIGGSARDALTYAAGERHIGELYRRKWQRVGRCWRARAQAAQNQGVNADWNTGAGPRCDDKNLQLVCVCVTTWTLNARVWFVCFVEF